MKCILSIVDLPLLETNYFIIWGDFLFQRNILVSRELTFFPPKIQKGHKGIRGIIQIMF
jgi:hypothetical protein